MKKNLVFIGMPGCGKSTVGVIVAKTLGMTFIDTDLLIQEGEHMLLQRLIDKKGNEHFKKTEAMVLKSLVADHAVIATGGSAVYSQDGMEHLQEHGTIVYIRLGIKTIRSRLKNIRTRGIAMTKGESIETLYQERIPLYEKYADITIDGEGKDLEAVVEDILQQVSENSAITK